MRSLLSISLALFAGLMMTRVFKVLKLRFPDVTAFLIAGLFIGPYGLGRLGLPGVGFSSYGAIEQLSAISQTALGFIAFAIGNAFRLTQLKRSGRQAITIGIIQSVAATVLVDASLLTVHSLFGNQVLSVPTAITLGAIAAATAPAATLMVVRQYKAHGPLTSLLLPIVALDDAVGLVIFAVSFGAAQAMHGGDLRVAAVVADPLLEILCSLALGALMGALLTALEKTFFSNSNRLSLTISFVVLTIALSSLTIPLGPVTLSFSSLLVCMMLGTTFCNLCDYSADIMDRADQWTAPLFALFFVLSGAGLDLGVFTQPAAIGIGAVYILARSLGKYLGARVSASAVGCSKTVTRYLGVTLLPQAGVALGMCMTASALGQTEGALIRSIVLFGVLVYELFGPMITKHALAKAGEIQPAESEQASRNRFRKDRV